MERIQIPEEPENDLSKIREFYNLHVREYSSDNFNTYREQQINQWVEKAYAMIDAGEPVHPMWLRRNEGGGTFWGACVDYMMPAFKGGDRVYATIFIDGGASGGPATIEVWLPKKDGSGEPIVEFDELYDLESLDRAVEFVESTVLPRQLRRAE